MLSTSRVFLIALLIVPAVLATVHSGCYNFYVKSGCIHSAADEKRRCKPQDTSAKTFAISYKKKPRLSRRYDAFKPIYTLDSDDSVCQSRNNERPYDTNTQSGACVYAGIGDGSKVEQSGWVNGAKTSNCGKELYIQRKLANGTLITVYAPIIDGCGFDTKSYEKGCAQIYLTVKTFNELLPTPKEKSAQQYDHLTWDFNNLDGTKSKNAPV